MRRLFAACLSLALALSGPAQAAQRLGPKVLPSGAAGFAAPRVAPAVAGPSAALPPAVPGLSQQLPSAAPLESAASSEGRPFSAAEDEFPAASTALEAALPRPMARSASLSEDGAESAAQAAAVFDGRGRVRRWADAVRGAAAGIFFTPISLGRSRRASGPPPASAESGESEPPAPGAVSSLKRSLQVGLVSGSLSAALWIGGITAAVLLGWDLDPGYEAPTYQVEELDEFEEEDGEEELPDFAKRMVSSGVLAPAAEEYLFRYGMFGAAAKLVSKVTRSRTLRFWTPALVNAAIFAVVHESKDPVCFLLRFAGSLILARVYAREGLAAAIAMHGVHNIILSGPMGILPIALPALAASARDLWRDRYERAARRIVPYQLKAPGAVMFAAMLALGILIYPMNPVLLLVWGAPVVGYLVYAWMRHRRAQAQRFQ